MNNGIMSPELIRLAQEQMSKIPPEELAKIQQQMMSNPELIRLATESMKNLRTEDVKRAAEQFKHTRAEDMVEISEKIAKATPEEIAAMKAHADAQMSYELNGAKILKQQGNELHSRGEYVDAVKKYMRAKNNLKSMPTSDGVNTLQLQCSLNLMSCYLKTREFEECIREGSEVLDYDSRNVKALYRRGQAYKELGKLEAAVSDLNNAHSISPDDETIADVLRDTKEKLMKEGKDTNVSQGVVIEEILDEEIMPPGSHGGPSVVYSVTQPFEAAETSGSERESLPDPLVGDDLTSTRLFQNYVSNANPDDLAALDMHGMSPDLVKTATSMISSMKPEELQKMFQAASSLNGKGPSSTKLGSTIPEMTPEMVKMASDTIGQMSPDELQKMLKVASSLGGSSMPSATARTNGVPKSGGASQSSVAARSPSTVHPDVSDRNSDEMFFNQRMSQSSSSIPNSTADLETMRNSMKDPAMQQMFTSMMKNMSPEMMADMSEKFGMKISRDQAAQVQQAMSSISPEDLDTMMRWVERAQRGVDTVKKTKNWILGRPGLILAIVMLILAFIFHQLGLIGG
ncbi:outer envelope protein 61 [Typha angustifolia]|uniref:outer envelope protein 61 n=1 Tax=Typha angustifolia TaxID=59011 RepID=UPI003C2BE937